MEELLSKQTEADASTNDEYVLPMQSEQPPTMQPKRKTPKLRIACIALAISLLASGTAFALYKTKPKSTTSTKAKPISTYTNTPATAPTLTDLALLRYEDNSAYERTKTGALAENIDAEGSHTNVRKKSFNVSIETNGIKHDVTLDEKTVEFGATTDNTFYSLSCSVPDITVAGADNASFSAQFYDKTGKKLGQKSWKEQDTSAPTKYSKYCSSKSNYFNVAIMPTSFSNRNYGREHIDDLNYKVTYLKADGSKQDIDSESAADIDIPLGATPDKKLFLYNRVSAKRTLDSCTDTTELPYKVVDFSGPINELHVYDLVKKTDTLVGTESSFSSPSHEINLSDIGYFSSDGSRYYLKEGGHGGCRGGDSKPIRIAYIDLKTNKLQTIESPSGKQYSSYCFTENGKYVLEEGAVDDYDESTPALTAATPTILDSSSGAAYVSPNDKLSCAYSDATKNNFVAISKTTEPFNEVTKDVSLNDLTVFNPSNKTSQSITFTKAIDTRNNSINAIALSSNPNVGYVNRSGSYDQAKQQSTGVATTIFNFTTKEVIEVPFAQVVL